MGREHQPHVEVCATGRSMVIEAFIFPYSQLILVFSSQTKVRSESVGESV